MPKLFKPKFNKPVVVVEIGNDWLKILEYNPSHKKGQVTRASFVKLVQIKEPVTEALSKAFKNLKVRKQGVIICIPRHLVTIRILEFPSIDPKEINDMVTLQVGKQTPYSREEIIFTNRPIQGDREGYTKVMLVIARRNIVNARIEALQKAGIEVEKVAVSSEGVYNWFGIAYPSEINTGPGGIILLDIDSNYSDFIVMSKGQFSYTRNILIGSNHLLEDEGQWKDKFIEEVNHSMELYHNEERNVKIQNIFLSGAAKHFTGLDQALGAQLDLPVVSTDPFQNIKVRRDIDVFRKDTPLFVSPSPLLGMSIRKKDLWLDLTSSELRIQKEVEHKRKQITAMGILAASILSLLVLVLLISLSTRNMYLAQLKKQIAKIEKEANYVDRLRQHISIVQNRLDAEKRSVNVLNEIHKLTSREIYFTNIDIEEHKRTILQGNSKTMSNVFAFVTILEESPFFENVKTTYTTTKKEEGVEYTKFEIICMYEKKEEYE